MVTLLNGWCVIKAIFIVHCIAHTFTVLLRDAHVRTWNQVCYDVLHMHKFFFSTGEVNYCLHTISNFRVRMGGVIVRVRSQNQLTFGISWLFRVDGPLLVLPLPALGQEAQLTLQVLSRQQPVLVPGAAGGRPQDLP